MSVEDTLASVARVSYREGQVMTAADLTAEQTYLVAMRQTHAAAGHLWGIAEGLDLSMQGDVLSVSPGTAVDGLGRLLIVPQQVEVATGKLTGSDYSVWLMYAVEQGGTTRLREVTKIQVCAGVAPKARRTEASGQDWPVFLGALNRAAAEAPLTVQASARRPLTGLVGGSVRAASGSAMMRCGDDFAVALHSPGGEPDSFADQVRIGRTGNLCILGGAHFSGDMHVQPNAVMTPSGKAGVGFDQAIAPPAAACPWRIYHTRIPHEGLPAANELVFELQGAQDKEDPAGLRAAVGYQQGEGFHAALVIAADGTVTISGSLQVSGRLIESLIAADPSDPRFLVAMAAAAAGGTGSATAGALTVEVAKGKNLIHTGVEYTVTFKNNGAQVIQLLDVQEYATLNGQLVKAPADSASQPIDLFALEAGGVRTLDRSMSVATPGKLAIAVMVTGVSGSGPVSAMNAIEIQAT